MSKVGRKPIKLGSTKVELQNNTVLISGPKGKFTHIVPEIFTVNIENGELIIAPKDNPISHKDKALWGLHRALVANMIKGVDTGFEQVLKIVGLGFKAQANGKNLTLTLGYSHKIEFPLPDEVEIAIDKAGQTLSLKSMDKVLLGKTCDSIRSCRPPEPYKGTGIMRAGEVILRKAGKTKGS